MADSNRKGAFLLSDVRQRSLDGFWETVQTNAQFGWAAGGQTSPSLANRISTVDRIDFANDTVTASIRGRLSVGRRQLAGVSNANYGWFIGGLTPAPAAISLVDRVDFANDSPTSATTRGPITATTYGGSAVGNQYFGWHAGGLTPTITSTVTRIAWASDSPTAASVRGPLNQTSYSQAAVSNNVYGWWAGGYVPAATSVVGRIDFSNDSPTAATVRGPLSLVRTQLAGAANSNYAWFAGGQPSPYSRVDRVDFSNDTLVAVVRGNLSTAKYTQAATGNQNYAWFTGGYNPGTISTVDRIDYSNDSPASASPRGFIATRSSHAAVAGIANLPQYPTQMSLGTNQPLAGYGWFGGGYNAVGVVSYVDRIDFSNDSPTSASPRTNIDFRAYMGATGNANYGWFAGGSPGPLSSVARIDYSNDSPAGASPRGPLNFSLLRSAATGNSNYGWFASGRNTPLTPTAGFSLVDRIDYSNDSPTSASPRGLLSQARYGSAATGNANYGWWAGGYGTPVHSQIERIDFSNDSPAASSLRGLQPQGLGGQAATSNANYGWFGGAGLNPVGGPLSVVNRIDFSNDSPTAASPRGLLSVARGSLSAAGNANYGWFSGGGPGPTAPFISSIVDRIDYSNDSPTSASPRGLLSQARTGLGGTSNYVKPSIGQIKLADPFIGGLTDGTYGWFGGGYAAGAPSVIYSRIDRIDFSNDSPATASVRGILNVQRRDLAATGNANYGWFVAGRDPTFRSSIDRVSWANDSPTSASARGFLSSERIRHTGTGNANYGWFAGGQTSSPGAISTVDRIDYANDSPTNTTIRGPLSSIRLWPMATANANYGWFGGGYNAAFFSLVDRIDFSNDSPTAASPRGVLSSARYKISATSNANYGWFVGGIILGGSLVSTVDRIDFSNDSPTSASPRGPLTAIRYQQAGAGNIGYGWHGGGFTPGGNQSSVERINYSNDSPTSASVRGPLSVSRYSLGASSNYVKLPPQINVAQYNIGTARASTGAGTFGWFSGGAPGTYSNVDRIDFANDTASPSARGNLPFGMFFHASAGNANYGWLACGNNPANNSLVHRIDYANDSPTSASPRGPLTVGRSVPIATANSNYGWFAGGVPGPLSTVDRIDFANDSPVISGIRGPLSFARGYSAATGNANYAWFNGGELNISTVDRIDYANDSPTSASPRGPLSNSVSYSGAGIGNANYGWFAGGQTPGNPGGNATVSRIDFANDTTTGTARGLLAIARYQLAAAGNANYGWFAAGSNTGADFSHVDRIDFANDSPTSSSPRSVLPFVRRGGAGTSNYVA